jgi:hypothetical protein
MQSQYQLSNIICWNPARSPAKQNYAEKVMWLNISDRDHAVEHERKLRLTGLDKDIIYVNILD